MKRGVIVNGVLFIEPNEATFGLVTEYRGNDFFNSLGMKPIVEETETTEYATYAKDRSTAVDRGDDIYWGWTVTLKEGDALIAGRKAEIIKRIRKVYDADDVEAIMRKVLADNTDAEAQTELAGYNTFVESVKAEIDAEIDALNNN